MSSLIELLIENDEWGLVDSIYNIGAITPAGVFRIIKLADKLGLNLETITGYNELLKADYRQSIKFIKGEV
jgi:hypothetical protein